MLKDLNNNCAHWFDPTMIGKTILYSPLLLAFFSYCLQMGRHLQAQKKVMRCNLPAQVIYISYVFSLHLSKLHTIHAFNQFILAIQHSICSHIVCFVYKRQLKSREKIRPSYLQFLKLLERRVSRLAR